MQIGLQQAVKLNLVNLNDMSALRRSRYSMRLWNVWFEYDIQMRH